jgi:cytochrome o ubiquinol oxidase subunit 2
MLETSFSVLLVTKKSRQFGEQCLAILRQLIDGFVNWGDSCRGVWYVKSTDLKHARGGWPSMRRNRGLRRLAAALMLAAAAVMLSGCTERFVVLQPKGIIGQQQKELIIISTLLCLIIVVPVLVMAFYIAWRYRDRPARNADYKPDWAHNAKLEITWWGIPIIIIAILATITARYSYSLEPSKPIETDAETMVIQVTSLDWKWLFQYPEQGIATVNYVAFPEDVQIRFELTSDAPMNSFWIPQLGGQIYTMSGMAMKLHLMADEPGVYMGSGANFSGKDFAKMRFEAEAMTAEDFEAWVARVKSTAPVLTQSEYEWLATPGTSDVLEYASFPEGLFERTVVKYINGGSGHRHGGHAAEDGGKAAKAGQHAAETAKTSADPGTEGVQADEQSSHQHDH